MSGFHLRLHHFAIGQNDLGRIGLDGAFGHAVERLLTDLYRLAHLVHADDVARPDIAIVRDRHLELELFVAGVGHVAAQVPIDAASAQRRPGDAERDGVFGGEMADALGAIDPDGIAGQQVLILVDLRRHDVEQLLHALVEIDRRLHRDAADAEVGGHHALAGDVLEDLEQLFALAEAIEEDGKRADVHGVRAQPDQVRLDAGQLVEQHPQIHCARSASPAAAASRPPGQ